MLSLRLSSNFCNANALKQAPGNRCTPRIPLAVFCQTEKGATVGSTNQAKDNNGSNKQFVSPPPPRLSFIKTVLKLGKEVKESLSPKQKGDWKDVVLMSLSFAVYVYMSQKIVCAYCACKTFLVEFCERLPSHLIGSQRHELATDAELELYMSMMKAIVHVYRWESHNRLVCASVVRL